MKPLQRGKSYLNLNPSPSKAAKVVAPPVATPLEESYERISEVIVLLLHVEIKDAIQDHAHIWKQVKALSGEIQKLSPDTKGDGSNRQHIMLGQLSSLLLRLKGLSVDVLDRIACFYVCLTELVNIVSLLLVDDDSHIMNDFVPEPPSAFRAGEKQDYSELFTSIYFPKSLAELVAPHVKSPEKTLANRLRDLDSTSYRRIRHSSNQNEETKTSAFSSPREKPIIDRSKYHRIPTGIPNDTVLFALESAPDMFKVSRALSDIPLQMETFSPPQINLHVKDDITSPIEAGAFYMMSKVSLHLLMILFPPSLGPILPPQAITTCMGVPLKSAIRRLPNLLTLAKLASDFLQFLPTSLDFLQSIDLNRALVALRSTPVNEIEKNPLLLPYSLVSGSAHIRMRASRSKYTEATSTPISLLGFGTPLASSILQLLCESSSPLVRTIGNSWGAAVTGLPNPPIDGKASRGTVPKGFYSSGVFMTPEVISQNYTGSVTDKGESILAAAELFLLSLPSSDLFNTSSSSTGGAAASNPLPESAKIKLRDELASFFSCPRFFSDSSFLTAVGELDERFLKLAVRADGITASRALRENREYKRSDTQTDVELEITQGSNVSFASSLSSPVTKVKLSSSFPLVTKGSTRDLGIHTTKRSARSVGKKVSLSLSDRSPILESINPGKKVGSEAGFDLLSMGNWASSDEELSDYDLDELLNRKKNYDYFFPDHTPYLTHNINHEKSVTIYDRSHGLQRTSSGNLSTGAFTVLKDNLENAEKKQVNVDNDSSGSNSCTGSSPPTTKRRLSMSLETTATLDPEKQIILLPSQPDIYPVKEEKIVVRRLNVFKRLSEFAAVRNSERNDEHKDSVSPTRSKIPPVRWNNPLSTVPRSTSVGKEDSLLPKSTHTTKYRNDGAHLQSLILNAREARLKREAQMKHTSPTQDQLVFGPGYSATATITTPTPKKRGQQKEYLRSSGSIYRSYRDFNETSPTMVQTCPDFGVLRLSEQMRLLEPASSTTQQSILPLLPNSNSTSNSNVDSKNLLFLTSVDNVSKEVDHNTSNVSTNGLDDLIVALNPSSPLTANVEKYTMSGSTTSPHSLQKQATSPYTTSPKKFSSSPTVDRYSNP